MAIRSFRDLDAWTVAMDLTVRLYEIIGRLPSWKRFELASQMRRAAVSVPSNVAEGQANGPSRRNRYHVRIALGSTAELSTCVEVCRRVKYIDEETAASLQDDLARASKLLHGLENSIIRKMLGEAAKAVAIFATCWWLLK